MKVFLIAAVAVAVSGAAFAGDLKGAVMTDSEMDKVTAGGYDVHTFGRGWVSQSNVNYNGAIHGFRGQNYHAAYTNY